MHLNSQEMDLKNWKLQLLALEVKLWRKTSSASQEGNGRSLVTHTHTHTNSFLAAFPSVCTQECVRNNHRIIDMEFQSSKMQFLALEAKL